MYLALLFDTNSGWEILEKGKKKGGPKAGPIKIDPLKRGRYSSCRLALQLTNRTRRTMAAEKFVFGLPCDLPCDGMGSLGESRESHRQPGQEIRSDWTQISHACMFSRVEEYYGVIVRQKIQGGSPFVLGIGRKNSRRLVSSQPLNRPLSVSPTSLLR